MKILKIIYIALFFFFLLIIDFFVLRYYVEEKVQILNEIPYFTNLLIIEQTNIFGAFLLIIFSLIIFILSRYNYKLTLGFNSLSFFFLLILFRFIQLGSFGNDSRFYILVMLFLSIMISLLFILPMEKLWNYIKINLKYIVIAFLLICKISVLKQNSYLLTPLLITLFLIEKKWFREKTPLYTKK